MTSSSDLVVGMRGEKIQGEMDEFTELYVATTLVEDVEEEGNGTKCGVVFDIRFGVSD